MDQAHWHLLLNHTPILGSLFGLLLLAFGLLRHNAPALRIGLITVLVSAVLCIPTQLTGEGAEEVVEDMPGITHAIIHEHEEAAEVGFWAMEATGVLALLALLMPSRGRLFTGLTLVATAASFGLLARAGNLGGQISHPEIRPTGVNTQTASPAHTAEEHEDND
jgi:hypothetical protein